MTDPYKHRDGCKYIFAYKKGGTHYAVNKPFLLSHNNDERVYGQFITSNWFKVPFNGENDVIFGIFKLPSYTNIIQFQKDMNTCSNVDEFMTKYKIQEAYKFSILKDDMLELICKGSIERSFKKSFECKKHKNVKLILSFYKHNNNNELHALLPNFDIKI